MLLSDLLDLEKLLSLIEQRYISQQWHPDVPGLSILNYTHEATYDGVWVHETKTCRGLIVQHDGGPDGEIVARPFPKFHNYGEHLTNPLLPDVPLDDSFMVKSKEDGSLGIVYVALGTPRVATRGSFTSDQAEWATKHLQRLYGAWEPRPGTTPLVEIVAKWNRIVVDYGDREDLIHLATIDNETGRQVAEPSWPGPRAKQHNFASLEDLMGHLDKGASNEEGFVVTFDTSGLMVKFKYDEYVRLHRILTGLSERRIWEHISQGGRIEDFVDGVPDEFFQFIHNVDQRLRMQHDLTMAGLQAKADHYIALNLPTRRDLALALSEEPDRGWIFRAVDGQWDKLSEVIWRSLKPVGNVTFRNDDDS